jgi:hypothetical protein
VVGIFAKGALEGDISGWRFDSEGKTMAKIKQVPATLEFMKDTVKKDPAESCEYVGAEALMELEENWAAISAALAG